MNKEILDSFVELMAGGFGLSDERLRKWLEIYYQIRRAAEEREETEKAISIYRAFSNDDLNAEIAKYAAQANHAEEIIAAVAEEEAPDEETPAAEPLAGFEAVEVKKPESLRGAAAREFKYDTTFRLVFARRDKKLSLQAIADMADGLTMSDLLSILECQPVDYKIYVKTAQALDALGV